MGSLGTPIDDLVRLAGALNSSGAKSHSTASIRYIETLLIRVAFSHSPRKLTRGKWLRAPPG